MLFLGFFSCILSIYWINFAFLWRSSGVHIWSSCRLRDRSWFGSLPPMEFRRRCIEIFYWVIAFLLILIKLPLCPSINSYYFDFIVNFLLLICLIPGAFIFRILVFECSVLCHVISSFSVCGTRLRVLAEGRLSRVCAVGHLELREFALMWRLRVLFPFYFSWF